MTLYKKHIQILNTLLEKVNSMPNISDTINSLVWMGFGHKRVYKPTPWKYATKMLNRACELGLVQPYDFGRGKGKFRTKRGVTIEDVVDKLQSDDEAIKIAAQYKTNWINKQQNQSEEV